MEGKTEREGLKNQFWTYGGVEAMFALMWEAAIDFIDTFCTWTKMF